MWKTEQHGNVLVAAFFFDPAALTLQGLPLCYVQLKQSAYQKML